MKAIFILEGKLDESHQCALSEAMDVLAKDWGLSSYLDDVLEDDVCEHNNTITNECSDCNEQELLDNKKQRFSCDIVLNKHLSFKADNEEQFIQKIKDKWLEDYNIELTDEEIIIKENK